MKTLIYINKIIVIIAILENIWSTMFLCFLSFPRAHIVIGLWAVNFARK
jgi:hypothetical protein